MELFKKVSSGMLCKGGIFGTGVLGVYLWRKRYLPQYMGIISMGVTSLGLCRALWDFWKGEDTTKQDSYNAERKEIVDALYRKVVAQGEEQASQRGSEDGIEEQEGDCRLLTGLQIANGNEEPAGANQSESKLPAVPNEANIASAVGSSSRACASSFSRNDVLEADESKVDELAAEVLEVPVLEDDVDEELAREFATEGLDAEAEKAEDVCEIEGAAGGSTSYSCDGEVFHRLSKFSGTNRPDMQKNLTFKKEILKGCSMKKSRTKRRYN